MLRSIMLLLEYWRKWTRHLLYLNTTFQDSSKEQQIFITVSSKRPKLYFLIHLVHSIWFGLILIISGQILSCFKSFIFISDQVQKFSKINRNIYKPPVSESTKNIVRHNFTKEIEFFEFCKQRLHKQYLALNLH